MMAGRGGGRGGRRGDARTALAGAGAGGRRPACGGGQRHRRQRAARGDRPGSGRPPGADGGADRTAPGRAAGRAERAGGQRRSPPAARGRTGGPCTSSPQGDTSFDPTTGAGAAPTIPAAPSGATAIGASALGADVSVTGDAVIARTSRPAAATPSERSRVSGDLYVTATLRAGDLGAGRQGLDLEVGRDAST